MRSLEDQCPCRRLAMLKITKTLSYAVIRPLGGDSNIQTLFLSEIRDIITALHSISIQFDKACYGH